ncbi:unnamed protein product, partial [Peniophora sp. CBMAI 1063]
SSIAQPAVHNSAIPNIDNSESPPSSPQFNDGMMPSLLDVRSVIAQTAGPAPPTTTTISRDDAVEAAQAASTAKPTSAPKAGSGGQARASRVTAKSVGVKTAYDLWCDATSWTGNKKSRQAHWRNNVPKDVKQKYLDLEKAAI